MSKRKDFITAMCSGALFCWVLGIALAFIVVFSFNGSDASKLTLLAEHFLYEFDYKSLEYGMLFSTVLFTRLPVLIVILISTRILNGKKVCNGISTLYGFTMGYVLFVLCFQYGFRGILLCGLFWTPHMFLYLFVIYNLSKYERLQGGNLIILCSVYVVGMLGEIYINPAIINSMVKFL